MSGDGKYARNIMEWNKGYLGGPCERDVQELGVKLTLVFYQSKQHQVTAIP